DMMYAQGLYHFKNKLRYWFDREDIRLMELKNEKHQLQSFEFELVRKHYRIPDAASLAAADDREYSLIKYVSATDIANDLANTYNKLNVNNTVVKNIGSSLKKLGFYKLSRRVNGNPTKLWVVEEIISPGKTESI